MRVYLDVSMDGLVVGFAVLLACASAIFFGFVPALRSSRVDLVSIMKDDLSPRTAPRGDGCARRWSSRRSRCRCSCSSGRRWSCAASIARETPTPASMRAMSCRCRSTSSRTATTTARGRVFYEQLLDSRAGAGRHGVGEPGRFAPADASSMVRQGHRVEGYQPRRDEDLRFLFNVIAPDYFRTLRIGLVAGREFNAATTRRRPSSRS